MSRILGNSQLRIGFRLSVRVESPVPPQRALGPLDLPQSAFLEVSCLCTPTQVTRVPGDFVDEKQPISSVSVTPLEKAYEVNGQIGAGGMGTVYVATQISLGRRVAIKKMAPHFIDSDSKRARFEREAKAVSRLNHPHILSVFDYGVDSDNAPFMVMEFIEGRALSEIVKAEGAIDPQRTIAIAIQLCLALEHAHQNGIVHRDVKPSNIMVQGSAPDEHAKLVDFGLAKLRTESDSGGNLTATGDVIGSPYYMSPEQCCGQQIDGRSDLYSLACVLYEALTGKPPFVGNNILETCHKHLTEPVPHLRLSPEFEQLAAVVEHGLKKDNSQRYQSAAEMRHDLERIAGGIGPVHVPRRNAFGLLIFLVLGAMLALVLRANNVSKEPQALSVDTSSPAKVGTAILPEDKPTQSTAAKKLAQELRNRVISADQNSKDMIDQKLAGADLSGLETKNIIFMNCDLSGSNLANIIIHSAQGRASFTSNDLRDADLTGATIQTWVQDSKFQRAILNGAHFIQADIQRADFSDADLRNAEIESTFGWNAVFRKARMQNVRLRGDFWGVIFDDANLDTADGAGARFENSRFRDASLRGFNFKGSNLKGVDFTNADLTGADFTGATLSGAVFTNAKTDGALNLRKK